MNNTTAFYKLAIKRIELEEEIQKHEELIKTTRDSAKTLKKGSAERQELMNKINELQNQTSYIVLKEKLKTLYYCINTVFY